MKLKKLMSFTWQKWNILMDNIFRKGADFSSWESVEALGLSADGSNDYQPSTGALKKALGKFNVSSEDRIIDIGCGKGLAMYMMSSFPFQKIDGYDISEKLTSIANDNFKKLGLEKCEAFVSDANEFTEYDEYTYFYAFNPFPEEVFKKMLQNVALSLERKPRKVVFIYMNPVYHEAVLQHLHVKLIHSQKAIIPWFKCCCYSN